jgi:uncharacterized protein (TIGR03435 family)
MKRAILSALVSLGVVLGQSAESQPKFTTAEILPSKQPNGGSGFMPSGQFMARGATLLNLISTAYGVEPDMVTGGPNWLDSDRFDINTKAPAGTQEDAGRLMLQAMLAERFKLVIKKEDKPMPVYALTVGKRGLKLKESSGDGSSNCKPGAATPPMFTLSCEHIPMSLFVRQLRGFGADRPVVDLTELKGSYDYTMTISQPGLRRPPANGEAEQQVITVFDAVDKLGLKLEAQKLPTTVIVVDHVNPTPTENPANVTILKPKGPVEFEVSDVRVSKPGTQQNMRMLPSGRMEMVALPMKMILQFALNNLNGTDDGKIVGIPKWAETEQFDIVAKAAVQDVNPDALPKMLHALLVERFKLATHEEEQSIPVYAMVVSKRGLKLKESDSSVRGSCKAGAADSRKTYTCQNTTMAQLSEKLQGQAPAYIDHSVIDMTGLKGAYDFVLSWTPRGLFMNGGGRGGDAAGGAPVAADPSNDLTFFEAIERQIGVKLEVQKHTMPVIVIDRLERVPTEN